MNETNEIINRVNWPAVIRITAKLTALTALVFAAFKVIAIAQSIGALAALVFAGMHLPLCLFSVPIVLWFLDDHPIIGSIALTSAILNALLI